MKILTRILPDFTRVWICAITIIGIYNIIARVSIIGRRLNFKKS